MVILNHPSVAPNPTATTQASTIYCTSLFQFASGCARIHSASPKTSSSWKLFLARASRPQGEEVNNANSSSDGPSHPPPTFISQEDLNFLAKLGAGSIGGAAAIKYGSILFPQITQPNIVQAIAMISAPVIVAVLLLIKQSRVN